MTLPLPPVTAKLPDVGPKCRGPNDHYRRARRLEQGPGASALDRVHLVLAHYTSAAKNGHIRAALRRRFVVVEGPFSRIPAYDF